VEFQDASNLPIVRFELGRQRLELHHQGAGQAGLARTIGGAI
jgi:hypothetical protein